MIRGRSILIPLVIAGLVHGSVAAAEAPLDLGPLVTTATRTPVSAGTTAVPVLVIERAEIERSMAHDLAELLQFHAGIEIGRNGGPGQNAGFFLRGTESNHTLVLLDGVEINPGTLGAAAIHNIRPDIIERIELVKGPRSALWGSEAVGGVLHIITRRAEEGLNWSASAGGGRYDTRQSAFEAGLRGKRGGVSFSFSNLDTGGFPTRTGSRIDRAHDNTTFGLRADTRVGAADVGVRVWDARGNTEYLDFFLAPVEQDFRNSVVAAEAGISPLSNWRSLLTLSEARDEIFQLASSDYVTTRRRSADWQNTFSPDIRTRLVAGLYYSQEDTRSLSFGSGFSDSSRFAEAYASSQLDRGPHGFLLAARASDHDSFGSALTWNAEYALALDAGLRLTAAAGTAYRAPDGTDRFGFGGNPDLEPERSRNLEVGIKGPLASGHWSVSAFQNDIRDLVEFVFDPVTFAGGNINVGEARIRGLDLGMQQEAGNWTWRLAAVLQDPENRSDDSVLARRSRASFTASVVRRFAKSELGLDLLASGSRKDSPFSEVVNAGYLLANLNGRFELAPRLDLRVRVENVLGRDYQTAAGFNSPGRGLYMSLAYHSH